MKLTLRDLFWLVLVCALAVGWSIDGTSFELPLGLLLLVIVSAFWFVIGFTSGAVVNATWQGKERD